MNLAESIQSIFMEISESTNQGGAVFFLVYVYESGYFETWFYEDFLVKSYIKIYTDNI